MGASNVKWVRLGDYIRCPNFFKNFGPFLEILLFLVVEGDKDGKHRGEGPEGGASVAHKR